MTDEKTDETIEGAIRRMMEIRSEIGKIDISQMEQKKVIAGASLIIASSDLERAKLIAEFDSLRATTPQPQGQ